MKEKLKYIVVAVSLVLVACSPQPQVPERYDALATAPSIYPDYSDVVVPCNIAPLVLE